MYFLNTQIFIKITHKWVQKFEENKEKKKKKRKKIVFKS